MDHQSVSWDYFSKLDGSKRGIEKLLTIGGWLNDEIIDHYLNLIASFRPQVQCIPHHYAKPGTSLEHFKFKLKPGCEKSIKASMVKPQCDIVKDLTSLIVVPSVGTKNFDLLGLTWSGHKPGIGTDDSLLYLAELGEKKG